MKGATTVKIALAIIVAAALCHGVCVAENPPQGKAAQTNCVATGGQEAVFKQKITELMTQKEWQWVDFGGKNGVMVEVARPSDSDNEHLNVTIVGPDPFLDSPEIALAKMGIPMPKEWKMTEWPLETTGEFSIPKADVDKLPAFIHAVFLKCFKWQPDYTATCAFGKP